MRYGLNITAFIISGVKTCQLVSQTDNTFAKRKEKKLNIPEPYTDRYRPCECMLFRNIMIASEYEPVTKA